MPPPEVMERELRTLLRDPRVRDILLKKAVVLELSGRHTFYFIVVNRYYERFHIKLPKIGAKRICSCEATLYEEDCYHVNAARAKLLLLQLRKPIETYI